MHPANGRQTSLIEGMKSHPKLDDILENLHRFESPDNIAGMARFGIVSDKKIIGISAPELKRIAKEIGRDHTLAKELWATEIYDARILAAFIEEPVRVTAEQMDCWAREFDNWAICDGCCLHLFVKTKYAWEKAIEWTKREPEFERRAGFTMMAVLAVHDKKAGDAKFRKLFPLIVNGATDERNGVKKAVNWALRQIGKRNSTLNKEALSVAEKIKAVGTPTARWIANDAIRELKSEGVRKRFKTRSPR